MNQGKKSFAHRSAPLKTQNRRVLPATCSTICGAIGHGAAGRSAPRYRSGPACRCGASAGSGSGGGGGGGGGGVHSS
ncbi:hypothetical protein WS96_16885 [Burkholderia sp. MSMB1835]|nr:hypothetical protein WS96_16885 [Burkholderia sp. MSMB1835]